MHAWKSLAVSWLLVGIVALSAAPQQNASKVVALVIQEQGSFAVGGTPMPNAWERTVAAYHAAETLLADGRVRAIGVSNFSPKHLEDLIPRSNVGTPLRFPAD
jgi:diketogulonate reductase-like aldo/keto reductase